MRSRKAAWVWRGRRAGSPSRAEKPSCGLESARALIPIVKMRTGQAPSSSSSLRSSADTTVRGGRRWSSNLSRKCLHEQPTWVTVCGTKRSMCGADAVCSAMRYQSLWWQGNTRTWSNKMGDNVPFAGWKRGAWHTQQKVPPPHARENHRLFNHAGSAPSNPGKGF